MGEEAREYSLLDKIWCMILLCLTMACFTLFYVILVTIMDNRPSLCIQDLYVPALRNPNPSLFRNPNPSLFNATPLDPAILIHINFKDRFNPSERDKDGGVQFHNTATETVYADLQMTVFYGVERSLPVANFTLPGFRMAGAITVLKSVVVDAPGLPWEDAINKVSGGLPVDLVVGLAVKYADDECRWPDKCDWPEGMVWADVAVDASGEKVSKKPITFAYNRFRY